MEDELFIMFYIAVPIVLLAAAFVYYMYRRREDIEKVSRSDTMPREEGETTPGQEATPGRGTSPTPDNRPGREAPGHSQPT